MVLRPNSTSESCSLSLEFTQPFDRSVAPSLVIEMANPRILVLFRQALFPTSRRSWQRPKSSRRYHELKWPGLHHSMCILLLNLLP